MPRLGFDFRDPPIEHLEATSIVQFSGISPVAIPPPAPSSFSQTMGGVAVRGRQV